MATFSQKSFAAGEVSPSMYAHVDMVKYQTGLKTCRNFIVMRHGGVTNRPGTAFIAEVKDSTKRVRLLPYASGTLQSYLMEFNNLGLRLIEAGVPQYDLTLNITGITNANPAVLTYTGTDPANGDEVYLSGITGAIGTYLNNRNFKVVGLNAGANTFELDYMDGANVNSTSFGAYTSGGTAKRVYTATTPYVEAELPYLQHTQSAEVMTVVHPDYQPREIEAAAGLATITALTFAPSIAAPGSVVNTGAAGAVTYWAVTAVAEFTYEESRLSTPTSSSAAPTAGAPITVSWAAVTGAIEYNIYRKVNDVWGYVGVSGGLSFIDRGPEPDLESPPPVSTGIFAAVNDYPSAVAYTQQRRVFANTNNEPEKIGASRTGLPKNMDIHVPLQSDDAVVFQVQGSSAIKYLLDLGKLIVFGASGEWTIEGDEGGVLTPTGGINPKPHSYNGAGDVKPLIINGNAIYVQARGSIIRDLGFDYQVDGYKGNDITIFSAHLFDGYTIVDWAYQQTPHSIVWAVRDDGILLGLTYVREHEMIGWHQHDFDGFVENVCVVPEGTDDAVYLVVRRIIGGVTKRYIERMTSPLVTDVADAVIMDCALSYDGRNTSPSHTMTLSGGTTWAHTETLTITSSASFFTAADVGNAIHFEVLDANGAVEYIIRFTLEAYTSATVMTGKAHMTVPAGLRAVANVTWSRAVDQVSGLWHLEGKDVSILADGFVVASPNNEANTLRTVTNGTVTLDKTYSIIHVGLPITSDFETLDIDTADGETMANKKKIVNQVTLHVEGSRGIWIGGEPPSDDSVDPLEGLREYKARNNEAYDDPVALKTGKIAVDIQSSWNDGGHVFVRQVDPLPLTVLAVHPSGLFPVRRK